MNSDNRRVPDHFAKQAKEQGYAARSVYKLKEMDAREHLLGPGLKILDLGCAPGSWMQYAAERIGPKGLVVGVDYRPVNRSLKANEVYIQSDVLELSAQDLTGKYGLFHLVLSDMMSDTMGHKATDSLRSSSLAEEALALACKVLLPLGSLLVKVFQGPDFNALRKSFQEAFETVKILKPRSSRAQSREIYLLGKEFKNTGQGEDHGSEKI